jgi:hypothetical protein
MMTIQEKVQKAHKPSLINLGKDVSYIPKGIPFDSKLTGVQP